MWIATRRTGLKGDKNQRASVPENLKVKNILLVQPLLNPNEVNVWKPCQVRGGVAATPPIYLGSGANFGPKIMFP